MKSTQCHSSMHLSLILPFSTGFHSEEATTDSHEKEAASCDDRFVRRTDSENAGEGRWALRRATHLFLRRRGRLPSEWHAPDQLLPLPVCVSSEVCFFTKKGSGNYSNFLYHVKPGFRIVSYDVQTYPQGAGMPFGVKKKDAQVAVDARATAY